MTNKLLLMLYGVGLVTVNAFAGTPRAPVKSDVPADLAREAKITLSQARSTALAEVRGGRIQSEELEREKGSLVFSFDIKVGARPGVEEVGVDAMTGKVIEKKHETDKSEAREKQEAASKKR